MLTKYPRKPMFRRLFCATTLLLVASPSFAQEAESQINSGDTAWVLVSTALVLMMTAPGLALFYGGLVSQRNCLSTLMHSFFSMCLIGVLWVAFGYSLAFGTDINGIIGSLNHVFFMGVGVEANGTIPAVLFAMFQGAFAIITIALISGCYAGRLTFSAYTLFSILWLIFVYCPLCHWVWGDGGWLLELGVLDFAGGTVVHISSGISALVACIVIGKRVGYPRTALPPHNLPFTMIGAALLWFGWFGFNGGSALAANGIAAMAFVTTNTAAATAGLTWAVMEWVLRGKPTILGVATGAVAGLVAITPGAGFVTVPASMIFGVGASFVCYFGINILKDKFGYDDALDVFGVHGLGGIWGALATGLFATTAVNAGGADGLFYGDAGTFVNQVIGVVAGATLAGIGTFVILKFVSVIVPLRVDPEDEVSGLDLTLHGEVAYNLLSPGMSHLNIEE